MPSPFGDGRDRSQAIEGGVIFPGEANQISFGIFLLTWFLVVCKIGRNTQEPGLTAIPLPPARSCFFMRREWFRRQKKKQEKESFLLDIFR